MPDRYEREIEDILRNIEDYRPKPSLRERLRLGRSGQARRSGRPRPRATQPVRHLSLSISDWCFLGSVLAGLVAAGFAYTRGSGTALTGALAVLALLAFLLGMLTFWRDR